MINTTKNESIPNEKLIAEMPVDGYPDHSIAAVFPMLDGDAFKEFCADVEGAGLRDDIVLAPDENQGGRLAVLDGRNRQRAALKTDTALRFRLFGSRESDGAGPAEYVISQNLRRRHLSPSQQAMAAADMLPFFEAQAKTNQSLAGGAEPDNEPTVDTSAEYAQVPARQQKSKDFSKGTSAARAAKQFGVGESSVKKAKKLRQEDPAAADQVRAGRKTLHSAATGKPSAGSKAGEDYEKALARIESVCGKQQATGIREGAILRNRNEVLLYAKQPDKKMLAMRALIDQGWGVKRALLYKAEDILPTHRVVDLADRASAAGGHYYQEVPIENRGIVVRLNIEVLPITAKGGKTPAKRKAARRK